MNDAGIYKNAVLFIEKFGDKAFVEAVIWCDGMMDSEDSDLLDHWNGVMHAIQEIHETGLVCRRKMWSKKRGHPYNAQRPIN